jgi:hypothetical protein
MRRFFIIKTRGSGCVDDMELVFECDEVTDVLAHLRSVPYA